MIVSHSAVRLLVFEYMFEYYFSMINSSGHQLGPEAGRTQEAGPRQEAGQRRETGQRRQETGQRRQEAGQRRQEAGSGPEASGRRGADGVRSLGRPSATPSDDGPLKAMSPGVVDYLFRQMVTGQPAEDVQWGCEGIPLSAQPPGAELARRLSETDLDALTPTELFHYVRAAQRLASWAESLREVAVGRYCAGTEPAAEDPP